MISVPYEIGEKSSVFTIEVPENATFSDFVDLANRRHHLDRTDVFCDDAVISGTDPVVEWVSPGLTFKLMGGSIPYVEGNVEPERSSMVPLPALQMELLKDERSHKIRLYSTATYESFTFGQTDLGIELNTPFEEVQRLIHEGLRLPGDIEY
jgi:hypothetical protein